MSAQCIDRNDPEFLAAFKNAKDDWRLEKYWVCMGGFARVNNDGYGDSHVNLPERRAVYFYPYGGGYEPAYYVVYEMAPNTTENLINDRAIRINLPLVLR